MANFPLTKQVFDKTAFDNTVNTSFSELTSSVVVSTGSNLPSVVEFFQYYQDLFYQIPKFGDTTSHQYLVITSQEYIGSENGGNEVVDALIAEITALREENLDLQQQLAQSTSTTVQDALNTLQNLNGGSLTGGGFSGGGSTGGSTGGGGSY
jgi:hypothetical protein